MNELDFSSAFKALTSYDPLRWQIRLYDRFRTAQVPTTCDLPTGLGKTSVIPIWLIAFASQLRDDNRPTLPCRLVYIVNRRTVVDQATEIAGRLRARILGQEATDGESAHVLEDLRCSLAKAAANSTDQPVAISTLRGEFADNEEWKADPSRPAIIVGTIDMIGSKLLFSGHGDDYRMRPHHAGLIGQDALIVHDEAHLTPAFGRLLRAIAREQQSCAEPRGIHVMELSATASSRDDTADTFGLQSEDEKDALVSNRLNSQKYLVFHEAQSDGLIDGVKCHICGTSRASSQQGHELVHHIAACGLRYQSNAFKVLIYVRSPVAAQTIACLLLQGLGAQGSDRVALLTGTTRGHERDQLLSRENGVYRALLDHDSQVSQTVYLVSTSAGEVGIDLDADHMVSDLTTLDSMIQRLGRVNRSGGEGRTARVDVILRSTKKEDQEVEDEGEKVLREVNTKRALERLPKHDAGGYDASSRALRDLLTDMDEDEKDQAFAPKPTVPPVSDILFDAWALTSIREPLPGRPEVAPYLHGLTDDPPETYVVWRSEIKDLAKTQVASRILREWFQRCRIQAHERLRDVTSRVSKELKKIAKRQGQSPPDVVVLTERGEAELVSLKELIKRDESALQFRTIVLPVEAGALTREGTLDGAVKDSALDVAEADGKRARIIVRRIGNVYSHHPLIDDHNEDTDPGKFADGEEYSSVGKAIARIARRHGKVVSEIIELVQPLEDEEDEAETGYLLLLVEGKEAATENPELAGYEHSPRLDDHLAQAALIANKIANALRLEKSLRDAIVAAAQWHDRGKDRRRWQRAIFNDNPDFVFAKSGPDGMDWRRLAGYRHEFGSLLDAARDGKVLGLPESDLVLHLIAAHHGRARPHFDPDAWDTECHTTVQNIEAAQESMRRYARLQQRFGRWGLAWLESLVRCADVMASRKAQEKMSLPVEEYQ